MYIAPRLVRLLSDKPDEATAPKALADYREASAWVLLGEPGAGKSEAFKQEAEQCDGLHIPIAEFIEYPALPEWLGKALFLDGLDETRAGSGEQNTLLKVCAKLREVRPPRFRIACRAADWYGSLDLNDVARSSPDGHCLILQLEPLGRTDILEILRHNHDIPNPEAFIELAKAMDLAGLLENPQTLQLLAKAVRGEDWPDSRLKTFELACEKLAHEASPRHRQIKRFGTAELLDSAGHLFAGLLLADKSGISLDSESADTRFPELAEYAPPDLAPAKASVQSALFRPAGKTDHFQPCHRSIAEFLAARWLSQQIDRQGLPPGRVLKLLQGFDGRTVAGLRGLYAWLALHCRSLRQHLIDIDPITVIDYGDVKPMPASDKRHLLNKLHHEIKGNLVAGRDSHTPAALAALADKALTVDFQNWLNSPERDDNYQSFLAFVLDVLSEGEPIPELAALLKSVAEDKTRWLHIRSAALLAWLNGAPAPDEAQALLDAIEDERIDDPDDQLAGLLLQYLYPAHLSPEQLLPYWHPRKQRNFSGQYAWFWEHELTACVPDAHLPVLLDQLAESPLHVNAQTKDFHFQRTISRLLGKGLEHFGDAIDDRRLLAWLRIGADEYGDTEREQNYLFQLRDWLLNRPNRYLSLLAEALAACVDSDNFNYCVHKAKWMLDRSAAPDSLGVWHFKQAELEKNETLARYHLHEAFQALMNQSCSEGLDLEAFASWSERNPARNSWLEEINHWEMNPWRREEARRRAQKKIEHEAIRRERTALLQPYLEKISKGQAPSGWMHKLASIWRDLYTDIHGNTPLERFTNYCDNGPEALAAAESGFRRAPLREDVDSVKKIITLRTKNEWTPLTLACLIGMNLRWQDDPASILELSDTQLAQMAAMWLTCDVGDTPTWYRFLLRSKPQLLADVLADYVKAMLKAEKEGIAEIHTLAKDEDYRLLAELCLPRLLQAFPVRAKERQLDTLETLLKAGLKRGIPLTPVIEEKLWRKSMEAPQRIYWLTAGMLQNPAQYETRLWEFIGDSWQRANKLAWFVAERYSDLTQGLTLSAQTLGKLIELLLPHAEMSWSNSTVSAAQTRGDMVRTLLNRLTSLADDHAEAEIQRLRNLSAMEKLRFSLDRALHELHQKQRENRFSYPTLRQVGNIIANRAPISAADLCALTLDHLDDFAREIRTSNSDLFRFFWTEGGNNQPKQENSCRDVLLDKLQARLQPFGIDVTPEADQFNGKRADLRLSCRNEFELCIEIKRQQNDSLWSALRRQLIDQYSIESKADGHGIYLVLWFAQNKTYRTDDGNPKPESPDELRAKLETQLTPEERQRIHVRVLDVSWPN